MMVWGCWRGTKKMGSGFSLPASKPKWPWYDMIFWYILMITLSCDKSVSGRTWDHNVDEPAFCFIYLIFPRFDVVRWIPCVKQKTTSWIIGSGDLKQTHLITNNRIQKNLIARPFNTGQLQCVAICSAMMPVSWAMFVYVMLSLNLRVTRKKRPIVQSRPLENLRCASRFQMWRNVS